MSRQMHGFRGLIAPDHVMALEHVAEHTAFAVEADHRICLSPAVGGDLHESNDPAK